MQHIGDVVCAIIEKDGYFLIAQRPAGHPIAGKWEFPGGKIISGEAASEAIQRELFEELGVSVAVHSALTPSFHAYEDLSVPLIPFRCSISKGVPEPLEHSNLAWINGNSAKEYPFAEADIPVLQEYLGKNRCIHFGE